MAVYTPLSTEEISEFLQPYQVGELLYAKGIAEGVENTNYLLGVAAGGGERKFILTLYEKRVNEADLPFFMALMEHLARSNVPCATPMRTNAGEAIRRVQGRPAALISFLNGTSARTLQPFHTAALGSALASMHEAVNDFSEVRANALSLDGFAGIYSNIAGKADRIAPGLTREIEKEMAFLKAHWPKGLARGIIHADLFPDNVFFEGERLSGVIDFYFACEDFFLYDVAICLNAWCFEARGEYHLTRGRALLDQYHRLRPISSGELEMLPILARAASLRFLLTRAYDWLFRVEGALVTPKDPMEYLRKLRFHQTVKRGAELWHGQ